MLKFMEWKIVKNNLLNFIHDLLNLINLYLRLSLKLRLGLGLVIPNFNLLDY